MGTKTIVIVVAVIALGGLAAWGAGALDAGEKAEPATASQENPYAEQDAAFAKESHGSCSGCPASMMMDAILNKAGGAEDDCGGCPAGGVQVSEKVADDAGCGSHCPGCPDKSACGGDGCGDCEKASDKEEKAEN